MITAAAARATAVSNPWWNSAVLPVARCATTARAATPATGKAPITTRPRRGHRVRRCCPEGQ